MRAIAGSTHKPCGRAPYALPSMANRACACVSLRVRACARAIFTHAQSNCACVRPCVRVCACVRSYVSVSVSVVEGRGEPRGDSERALAGACARACVCVCVYMDVLM